jgi:hypothetical protein
LKEKLMRELESYADKGSLRKEDAETIKYISSAIDHIDSICEREDGEYSENMMGGTSYARSGRRGSYRGSYARGRRRDDMGRYTSDGYSMATNDMIAELHDMMDDAPEGAKSKIRGLINELERM